MGLQQREPQAVATLAAAAMSASDASAIIDGFAQVSKELYMPRTQRCTGT